MHSLLAAQYIELAWSNLVPVGSQNRAGGPNISTDNVIATVFAAVSNSKAILLTGRGGLRSGKTSRIQHLLGSPLTDLAVSLTHRRLVLLGMFVVFISVWVWVDPKDHSATGWIRYDDEFTVARNGLRFSWSILQLVVTVNVICSPLILFTLMEATFLRNVGSYKNHTTSYPRRRHSS
jgi:lysylphosphatidylglycerol synthetase-like protein (DUF2156 family)